MDKIQVLREVHDCLGEIATTLRETAEGLREWGRGGEDGISPHHAANRLEKVAQRIDGKGRSAERELGKSKVGKSVEKNS